MLTSQRPPTAIHLNSPRPVRPRRRLLAAPVLTAALGLGAVAGVFGFTTSPGRTGGGIRSTEVAIPGVRGTGGGGGGGRLDGISTSPGAIHLAVRKAGGGSLEYL